MLGYDAMLQGAVFSINGEERLRLSVADLSFTPERIVSHLSEAMTLRIGDLIYLGTPKSFDIAAGDNLRITIGDKTLLNFDIK